MKKATEGYALGFCLPRYLPRCHLGTLLAHATFLSLKLPVDSLNIWYDSGAALVFPKCQI